MSLFVQSIRSGTNPAPSTWTLTSLGDDTGSSVEDSATQVTLTTAGTNDPDNGQFAYQSVSGTADIQIITRVPSSWTGGTPENFTFFGLQIREALTGTPVFVQCAWPNVGTARAKHRLTTDGTIVHGYATGISGESLPQYLAITYDDSESEIKYWESADNSDWFQLGETVTLNLASTVYAGIFGVSHDLFQTITAVMTDCSVTSTITISEATPPAPNNRTGIIQDMTFLTSTFYEYGGVVTTDSASFRTYDSSDGSYQNLGNGGTWDSNWDMTRVDINTEESVSGPVDNNFVRVRLRYDQDYAEINGGLNKPRNNIYWGPGGNGERYEDDREFWFGMTYYFPSDYEIDSSADGNQEIILQWHNASGGQGHGSMRLGGIGSDQGRLNIILMDDDTSDQASGSKETNEAHIPISDLQGEFITFVYNCRFNPFATQTTATSAMGRYPQVDEVFQGNQGKFNVWMTVPSGATVTSNTLGTITNAGATQMLKVCEKNNTPVGLVPSWRNGVPGQNPLLPEFGIYKGRWMDQIDFASRPTIPHDHSSKAGPIDIYIGQCRMGDESSDYQSVHPEQEAQP